MDGISLDMELRELYAFLVIKQQRMMYHPTARVYCPLCKVEGALECEDPSGFIDRFFCIACQWWFRTKRSGASRVYEVSWTIPGGGRRIEIVPVVGEEVLPEASIPPSGSGKASLSSEEVIEMRNGYEAGESIGSLAVKFGVAYNSALSAIRGNTYKNV